MKPIYLDYNASTPVHPQVAEYMQGVMTDVYGNPSSPHWAGSPARERLEKARGPIAALLGASPGEIVFTSGGSESNNAALKGMYFGKGRPDAHIVTTQVEHPAITEPCRFLEGLGARISRLPVDGAGQVNPDDLRKAIRRETILISIMHANNEVGTVQPIAECARVAREFGVPLHTDAAQSAGKIPTRVDELGVDLLSLAGHKMYAPKGVGALYVRGGLQLEPLIHGAGHEQGRRAGTESVLLAGALGVAADLVADLSPMVEVERLRNQFWDLLKRDFKDQVVLNGRIAECLPNTLSVCFAGRIGAEILAAAPMIAASTGSACHAGSIGLSPVLAAMGISPQLGAGSIRFSLGRATTQSEIDATVDLLREVV